ncbi:MULTISPECIES: metallophosphoesterase [Comamonas]|uniref:metallophosphoesterase n=1 Tax=Comamonas TaxID=283 RepID=UPI00244D57F8|nr:MULTISPECIES: metallophosphoesterase [Comamonas]MDH1702995.1 metallophosphoesterase [Comamonas terrigena]MDI9855418.1 metallophosphoesterase [Comamonas sp. 17RB]
MSLIHTLPSGPLDVVGDIHGELSALRDLLRHLGYDRWGEHPQGRKLVFVGDFCDRGPDSPAVLEWVQTLVERGNACAALGNHEINLLREDPKDGSGWYFDVRYQTDQVKYAPFNRPSDGQRERIVDFLSTLPLGLEREDLRIIHAAWVQPQVDAARAMPAGQVRHEYDRWELEAARIARESSIAARMQQERRDWPHSLEDRDHVPPFLPAHSENELNKGMVNPLKVLCTGVERAAGTPFFAGGKWRFVERVAWWNQYTEDVPVIVGHYWRRLHPPENPVHGKQEEELFGHTAPTAWHGARRNVFCVDYSVGGRWVSRRAGEPLQSRFKLAALRWPERDLVFDDGTVLPTLAFQDTAPAL